MKSEIIDVSPTQKEIKIEIEGAAFKDSYNKVSQKYAKGASVPGFRKGFAPLDVVRLRFKEEIKSEVLQEVVNQAVSDAIQEHGVHPLTEPHLHLDDAENVKVNGTQNVSLHVHFEVMPEIPTPDYEGMEVTRRVKAVSDSEIEDLLANRQQQQAALLPVEGRKSQMGDTVIVDLEGSFVDDPDAPPIKADDLEVLLGDEVIEKAFTENLVGVEEDEEKEFRVSYPEGLQSAELAGKTVDYKAKIKSVGMMEVPELNDEWAKSLDEGYNSIKDLRKKLRDDLEKYAEADADARVRNNAIAKLIEKHEFDVPGALIESQARNLLNNFAQDLQQRGVDLNTVEADFVQMAYSQMQSQAERDVRGAMLLDKVAEKEKVEVSDSDVSEEIGKMADYYRTSAEEIRASLQKQGGGEDNIRNNLRTRKSIEALIAKAKIVDGEWVDENIAAATGNAETESAKPEKKKAKTAKKPAVAKEAKKKAAADKK
jgi:trigger factor